MSNLFNSNLIENMFLRKRFFYTTAVWVDIECYGLGGRFRH